MVAPLSNLACFSNASLVTPLAYCEGFFSETRFPASEILGKCASVTESGENSLSAPSMTQLRMIPRISRRRNQANMVEKTLALAHENNPG